MEYVDFAEVKGDQLAAIPMLSLKGGSPVLRIMTGNRVASKCLTQRRLATRREFGKATYKTLEHYQEFRPHLLASDIISNLNRNARCAMRNYTTFRILTQAELVFSRAVKSCWLSIGRAD